MTYTINGYEPERLFHFFEEISAIPRGSGNEKAASDYLVAFARERGLWVHQDELYNVIIKKPASPGAEAAPPVMLQGHLDMVCEKLAGVDHDFLTQGLDLVVEDGVLRANGTTLGGDDGVAVATMLAVLDDNDLIHPSLECVFTTQEEVGIRGSKTASWSIDPAYGIAVDVTDVDDTPGSEKSGTVQLGNGAAVRVMDSSIICHPEVVSKLEELAQEQGIPTQRDILRAGGTDAGAIHVTHTGVKTGGISVPCRYVHTPVEMADLNDTEHCVQLAAAFAQCKLG